MKLRMVAAGIVLALTASAASAEMYQWTDEAGTENFTDDLSSIPKKFRKKARKLGGEESATSSESVQSSPAGEIAAPESVKKEPAKADEQKPLLYGGKEEKEWRRDFGRLRAEIRQVEDLLKQRVALVANPGSMGRREYLSLQLDVKELQRRLDELRGKLASLTGEANKAGLPAAAREE